MSPDHLSESTIEDQNEIIEEMLMSIQSVSFLLTLSYEDQQRLKQKGGSCEKYVDKATDILKRYRHILNGNITPREFLSNLELRNQLNDLHAEMGLLSELLDAAIATIGENIYDKTLEVYAGAEEAGVDIDELYENPSKSASDKSSSNGNTL